MEEESPNAARPSNRSTGANAAQPSAVRLGEASRIYRSGLLRKRRAALRAVSLTVSNGETLGLLGPNGSGKSTLLALLAGLENPSSGAVQVLGAAPRSAEAQGRIGYAGDRCAYPAELSPRTLLRAIAALHGLGGSKGRLRVEELLERFGLTALASRKLERLSAGEKRRFELAQAFLPNPDLLLLDEPSAGLDAPGERVLAEALDEAQARGATILIASHDGADVFGRCSNFAVLIAGRLAWHSAAQEFVGRAAEFEWTLPREELTRIRERDTQSQACTAIRPTSRSLADLYAELGAQPPDTGSAP